MKQGLSILLVIIILSSFLSGCKAMPSIPETSVQETTAPETTVPETTVPETTVPETTVPETAVPETTVPETTVPETTVPETAVPETTVPETTVPETTVPETAVPSSEFPYLENISRADQSIYAGPSYDYGFVGTVQAAGIYTITEEAWDSEGNLWGKLKSGMGWVDLSDIRSSDKDPEPLTANFADAMLINSGNYHHYIADTSSYMMQIAFRAAEPLTDIFFYSLSWLDGYQKMEDLLFLNELTPDKPLVADVTFPGDMSMYGICFTDSQGVTHYYCISISGRNGSLVFHEYTPE